MREHDDLPGPENRGALEGSMDFSASYSENLPAVLERLNISLAFTSYQAGRLMLVRSACSRRPLRRAACQQL